MKEPARLVKQSPLLLPWPSLFSSAVLLQSAWYPLGLQTTVSRYPLHRTVAIGILLAPFNPSTMNNLEYDREGRSAVYKDTCYGPGAKVENCNLFVNQSLHYDKSDAGCPFDGHACHLGRSDTSIHFDTGLIDISELGFNAPAKQRLKFRRNMTCAPLLMDDRFIKIGHLPGGKTQWEYYTMVKGWCSQIKPNTFGRHPITRAESWGLVMT